MGNKDINLFKAAGGERAKGAKKSPVTYMLLVTLVVIVAAIGVLVFFNMKANNAEKAYNAKQTIISNYANTSMNVQAEDENGVSLASEYKTVRDDIEAAAAIGAYLDSVSTLYPKASDSEIAAVKNFVLGSGSYSVNDPSEEEDFVPWDLEGLRESMYEENASVVENRELFYYALQKLAQEQEENPNVNKWYTYYRDYLLIVFTGGDGTGLESLCDVMISAGPAMGGFAPFSKIEMANDMFSSGNYAPVKIFSKVYETSDTTATVFNCLLMPMKSVIERAFDVLEAHSKALIEANGWEGQTELASYGVDNLHYMADSLAFDLILPQDASLKGYMDAFQSSIYFSVANSVVRSEGEAIGGSYTFWKIILDYTFLEKKAASINEDEE